MSLKVIVYFSSMSTDNLIVHRIVQSTCGGEGKTKFIFILGVAWLSNGKIEKIQKGGDDCRM